MQVHCNVQPGAMSDGWVMDIVTYSATTTYACMIFLIAPE
jgi:hypothetical protein